MKPTPMFAFVLMPFDKKFDDLYRLGIKETAADLGITAERVDDQLFREGILERIYRQIDVADVVIAEMTGQNGVGQIVADAPRRWDSRGVRALVWPRGQIDLLSL